MRFIIGLTLITVINENIVKALVTLWSVPSSIMKEETFVLYGEVDLSLTAVNMVKRGLLLNLVLNTHSVQNLDV